MKEESVPLQDTRSPRPHTPPECGRTAPPVLRALPQTVDSPPLLLHLQTDPLYRQRTGGSPPRPRDSRETPPRHPHPRDNLRNTLSPFPYLHWEYAMFVHYKLKSNIVIYQCHVLILLLLLLFTCVQ